ncbi:MAG: hypothetical protein WB526_09005 [Candidatus Cybelea sp.]|jgi:sugar lactone lactonase YvrE
MKTLPLLSVSLVLGFAVSGCSSGGSTSGANLEPPSQGSTARRASDANGTLGWIALAKEKSLLYVSDEGDERIDIFSVPKYHLVGQITQGINMPEGIAIDMDGTLYVSNFGAGTVTVYKQGQITPSLTLTEPDGPDDVAVAKNGDVLVGDSYGGVDVYPPGATYPRARLLNPAISWVGGVGVDASNNVYAAGVPGVVIKFAKMKGSGTNLALTGLGEPTGVLVDKHGDLVVSDNDTNLIDIYPPGQTSPSSTTSVDEPERIALNNEQNQIYAPQGNDAIVSVFPYPSGSRITWIEIGKNTTGVAFYSAPQH